jgi:hypothetical protein
LVHGQEVQARVPGQLLLPFLPCDSAKHTRSYCLSRLCRLVEQTLSPNQE